MRLLLTALANLLAILGYVLGYLDNRRLHRYGLWLVSGGIVFASAAIWGNHYVESKRAAEAAREFASIQTQFDELRSLIKPVLESGRARYPHSDDSTILRKLASDISAMKPKLALLGQTEPRRDTLTKLVHTVYAFRSGYPVGVRDVLIKMRFDGRFVAVSPDIQGAFVEEYGTRMTVDTDSCGFTYATGYLREGNDIHIEVTSLGPLKILALDLLP